MKSPVHLLLALSLSAAPSLLAQDWSPFDVPANPGSGNAWLLNANLSDEFNYDSNTANGRATFFERWQDWKPNFFLGPGATYFSRDNWVVENDSLKIFASPVPAEDQIVNTTHPDYDRSIYTGYVTSKAKLQAGSFTEVLMKGGGTALATNFWMIDDGDSTEIDIMEIYGDTDWFRQRPRTNVLFHVRENGVRVDLVGSQAVHPNNGIDYSQTWHRYGVHWISETQVDFYYDGLKVRSMDLPTEVVDPSGNYLSEPMRLILNMESHVWRGEDGIPSIEELQNASINNMQVAWVRTYQAVLEGDYNNDGVVDLADYTSWRDALGTSNSLANDAIGGVVGAPQYDAWKRNIGFGNNTIGLVSSQAVPEPSAMTLLAALAFLSVAPIAFHKRRESTYR